LSLDALQWSHVNLAEGVISMQRSLRTEKGYNRIKVQIDEERKQQHPPLFVYASATIMLTDWVKRMERVRICPNYPKWETVFSIVC
jgi:hypothetical protein